MWWLIGWDVGTGLTNRMWIGMWRLIGRAYGWFEMASRQCFGHFIHMWYSILWLIGCDGFAYWLRCDSWLSEVWWFIWWTGWLIGWGMVGLDLVADWLCISCASEAAGLNTSSCQSRLQFNSPAVVSCHLGGYSAAGWRFSKQKKCGKKLKTYIYFTVD
jgi:hypothetical protein